VSGLTFGIHAAADFSGAKELSPWASLREKLFGIETDQGVPARFSATNGRNPQTIVRRFSAPVPYIEPLVRQPQQIVAAAPISLIPASAAASYQTEYKGRLIVASQLEDGSWTASHAPLGTEPLCDLSAENLHRFMARVLAIASAEIEIDDLGSAGVAPQLLA
jgi:hypothetical protein